MAELTPQQREFLEILAKYDRPVTRRELARLADRQEDKVRQACRRAKLCEFVGGWLNGRQLPMGWRITPAGRAALATLSTSLMAGRAGNNG